ncbi:MAG: hypothetical protein E7647_00130 [Ruminococcaceae bacterium]|nr:hypothetical protein [Oscillospiraceae bacterium]
MKRTTKIISVLVAFVLLISAMNIGIFAASYIGISVGEIVTASVSENYGKLALEFIPEESGAYAFYSMGDFDTCGYIFDSEMNMLCESDDYTDLNFYAVCSMTAGEKYYLRSELYSNDGEGEYSVTVEKVNPAEELIIYHGGETVGYVGKYLSFECLAEPEGSFPGDLTWESDNEDVAVIDYCDGAYCDFYLVGVGNASISVSTPDGLFDTVEISVIDIPEILVDAPAYLTFGPNGGTRCFAFTPERDGEYAVCTAGAGGGLFIPDISIYDSEYEYVGESDYGSDSGEMIVRAHLLGGETYTIEVSVILEAPDFMIYVTPCIAAEGVEIITFDGEMQGCFVGMTMSFSAAFSPDIAISEDCTWTVDNADVASISYQDGVDCEVLLLSEGTATLTVTTDSGLCDSYEISCAEVPGISLDEIKTSESAEGDYYKFIPEEDGNYSFICDSECGALGVLLDSEWNVIAFSDIFSAEYGFSVQADMTAGETYYLYAVKTEEQEIDVKITKSIAATEVTLSCGSELYAYVGEYMTIEALFGDRNVEVEGCVFFAYGSVASVDYYDNYCDVYFEEAGSTKITVLTDSGLKAVCTVHVADLEIEQIVLDEEYTVEVGKYANDYFGFTPEEDGTYSFISNGYIDTYAALIDRELYEYDYDDDGGEGYNFCLQLEMEAGEEYVFRTSYYEPYTEGDTFTVKIIKSPAAEEMILCEEGTVNASVGSFIEFIPEFLPAGSEREEVYFRVSDRSVIEVLMEDEYSCTVIVNGEGVATLEAFTDSGLYASVTVVAGDAVILGDVNGDGDINAVDTNMLKRFIGGTTTDIVVFNSDMNGDGSIDAIDSNLLKRLVAGR